MEQKIVEKDLLIEKLQAENLSLFSSFEEVYQENKYLKQELNSIKGSVNEPYTYNEEYSTPLRGRSSFNHDVSNILDSVSRHKDKSRVTFPHPPTTPPRDIPADSSIQRRRRTRSLSKPKKEVKKSSSLLVEIAGVLGLTPRISSTDLVHQVQKIFFELRSSKKFIDVLKTAACKLVPSNQKESITRSNRNLWKWIKSFFGEYMTLKNQQSKGPLHDEKFHA